MQNSSAKARRIIWPFPPHRPPRTRGEQQDQLSAPKNVDSGLVLRVSRVAEMFGYVFGRPLLCRC